MGWMNEFEQQHILSLYGKQARYRCNSCRRVIWVEEMEVTDPKGGYYRLPSNALYGSRYSRPKVTHCQQCDAVRRGKRPKEDYSAEAIGKSSSVAAGDVKGWVLKQIQDAPKAEWRIRKLIKMWPGKADKVAIRSAVKELRREKLITRDGEYLVPVTATNNKKTKEKRNGNKKSTKRTKRQTKKS